MQQQPMDVEQQQRQNQIQKHNEAKEELIKEQKISLDQENDLTRKQMAQQKIFSQIIFYTNPVNLVTDGYLRQTIQDSKDGFIPVNLFISFKSMETIFQDINKDMSHQSKVRLFFQAIKNKRRFFAYDRSKKTVKRLQKFDFQKAKKQFMYFQLSSLLQKQQFESILKQISAEINSQLNTKHDKGSFQMADEKQQKPKNRKQPLFQLKMGYNQLFGFILSKYIEFFKAKMLQRKQLKISLTLNYQQWNKKKKQCRKISKKLLKKAG